MKIGLRTIKTAIAAGLSMIVANYLGLLYAPAAGIIAILSVGNSKKTTLYTALGRLLSLAAATAISFLFFQLLGFTPLAFSIYLVVFISFSAAFSLTDGIVVNSVLVTHYMIEESFAISLILNEFLLMGIGVSFALFFNLYMPNTEKKIQENQREIEASFREILAQMATEINQLGKNQLDAKCHTLRLVIRQGQQSASLHRENHWLRSSSYYEEYFAMRRSQIRLLTDMVQLLEFIWVDDHYVEELRKLLFYTADQFAEKNDGDEILQKILSLYESYRLKPLPVSREEFENRAQLFQFLQLFKGFIEIKAEFSTQVQKN